MDMERRGLKKVRIKISILMETTVGISFLLERGLKSHYFQFETLCRVIYDPQFETLCRVIYDPLATN